MATFVLLAGRCYGEGEPPGLHPTRFLFLVLLSIVQSVCSVTGVCQRSLLLVSGGHTKYDGCAP